MSCFLGNKMKLNVENEIKAAQLQGNRLFDTIVTATTR